MRKRRTRRATAPSVEVEKYDEPVFGIVYKNQHDVVSNAIIPFGSDYRKRDSYKENFLDAFDLICSDIGGFWLPADKSMIPVHRILRFFMIEESKPLPELTVPRKNKPVENKNSDKDGNKTV